MSWFVRSLLIQTVIVHTRTHARLVGLPASLNSSQMSILYRRDTNFQLLHSWTPGPQG